MESVKKKKQKQGEANQPEFPFRPDSPSLACDAC